MIRSLSLPLRLPTVSVAMSSPIGFREFKEDGNFIPTISDEELIRAGKQLPMLCGDVVTPTPSTARSTDNLRFAGKNIGVDIRNDLLDLRCIPLFGKHGVTTR